MAHEHSIFISYRKVDGTSLATYVFHMLSAHSVVLSPGEVATMTFQIDRGIPGGGDWKEYLDEELMNASSLVVVCSPAAMIKYSDRADYLYHELEWWIANRRNVRPILVALREDGNKYVPEIILNTWDNLHVAEIETRFLKNPESREAKRYFDIFLESITRGINPAKVTGHLFQQTKDHVPIANNEGVYSWMKNRHGKYVYVSEDYAKAAGAISPHSMYGKTDYKMPWASLADIFRKGDLQIMNGDERSRMGVFEKEIMADREADILVTEGVYRDHSSRIIGVTGSFLDVSKGLAALINRKLKMDETGLYLGPDLGNVHLDTLETSVLIKLFYIIPISKIAWQLDRKVSEIKAVIRSLTKKFQCSSQDQLLVAAMRAGLPADLLLTKYFQD